MGFRFSSASGERTDGISWYPLAQIARIILRSDTILQVKLEKHQLDVKGTQARGYVRLTACFNPSSLLVFIYRAFLHICDAVGAVYNLQTRELRIQNVDTRIDTYYSFRIFSMSIFLWDIQPKTYHPILATPPMTIHPGQNTIKKR